MLQYFMIFEKKVSKKNEKKFDFELKKGEEITSKSGGNRKIFALNACQFSEIVRLSGLNYWHSGTFRRRR